MVYNETEKLWVQLIPGQYPNCTIEFFIEAWDISEFCLLSPMYSFNVKALPIGDLNGDGVVNMRDIGIVCQNFGKTEP